ncbi:hypothetical protein FCV25MIE_19178 [Fagus crenata]
MMRRQKDQQSMVFYELSALVLNILRSLLSSIPFSDQSPVTVMKISSSSSPLESRRSSMVTAQISLLGFTSLMLGISLAPLLCGSMTFFIKFLLMPWIFIWAYTRLFWVFLARFLG